MWILGQPGLGRCWSQANSSHMSLPVSILLWIMAEIQGLEELKPTPVVFGPCY